MSLERIPPHNDEAEKSVLGAAMLSKDALFSVLEEVTPEDFYSEIHKEIFTAMLELSRRSEAVDSLTVSEELKRRKALEMVGGRAYINSLSNSVPAISNAGQYAKIVAEKSVLRRLIKAADSIVEESFQEKAGAEDILDRAEKAIFEIAQRRQKKDYTPLQEILLSNMDMINKLANMEGAVTGLPTGFIDLDAKTAGFQKSNLIVLAARPAMGKTAFALNVALQASIKGGATVLIFSLEMAKEELGQRLLAMESRIEMQKLKVGQVERQDWEYMNIGLDTLSQAKIFIDDTPGLSILEIKNKCRRLKAEHGLDMIVVDYLQLMNYGGKTESRQQEISALSRMFKLLAREMDCPVILLSQLSRGPEQRADHRPVLSDLRESGSIEQDADMVIFLYRDDYYNPDTEKPGVCEVIIGKQRSGPTATVELTWIGKHTRFVDKSNLK